MAYVHGVRTSEVATSLLPAAEVDSAITIVIGTAPINQVDETNVNKPVLCYSYAEAVKAFGFQKATLKDTGFKNYDFTLSEAMYAFFQLYNVAPVVFVNVLDPKKHKETAKTTSLTIDKKTGSATIKEAGILLSSLVLRKDAGSEPYVLGVDYVTEFDDDGYVVVTSLTDTSTTDFKLATDANIVVAAEVLDPSKVTSDDIIGGVNADGVKSGLELVEDVFPKFRVAPSIIACPRYSGDAGVAAVMSAKADGFNDIFKAIALIDVPSTVKNYTDVATFKNSNNLTSTNEVVLWPCLNMSGTIYNFSSQFAALLAEVDNDNSGIPYVSPSNKNSQCTGLCLADGTEIIVDNSRGSYLNGNGIVTANNMFSGWVAWGNRTGAYPGNTDVKDVFIPVRRMFNFISIQLAKTFWQRIDFPLNRRQIDTVLDSANILLNGYTSKGYILGGRVEFLESENPTTDLMDGKAVFHVYITPPSPNREIDFVLEYDPSYLQTLFA